MFPMLERVIVVMGGIRLISGSLEIIAGLLILRFNDVEKAIMINSVLAVLGPIFFISSMTLGIVHIADKVAYSKLLLIGLGVGLIIFGLRK